MQFSDLDASTERQTATSKLSRAKCEPSSIYAIRKSASACILCAHRFLIVLCRKDVKNARIHKQYVVVDDSGEPAAARPKFSRHNVEFHIG